jgi:N-acetylneuraminic acid mutarotase
MNGRLEPFVLQGRFIKTKLNPDWPLFPVRIARAVCVGQIIQVSAKSSHLVTNRIRSTSVAVLFLGCLVTLTSAFNLPSRSPDLSPLLASLSTVAKPAQQRTVLTLADRVAYQRAIEEVYWRHRIRPKERPDPKPSLDEVMPPEKLKKKVEDYLRNSQALEDYWQKPISSEQLQAEMERMAQRTKQPEVLRELFEALGKDPYVIAECLARPALSERLLTDFYPHDQRFHGELRQRAEADLRTHHAIEQMKQTSGKYSEIELVRSDSAQEAENRGTETGVKLNSSEWDENVQKLAAMFGDAPRAHVKTGVLSSLQEDESGYYATAILKKSKDRLKLATIEWRKEPLESWRARAESQMPKEMLGANASYTLPKISDGASGCTDDTWTATASEPSGRSYHTAVWTGSEMIVWGGLNSDYSYSNTGGRYNPSTDSWTATSSTTDAPSARDYHTAVWTGTEMIVWGGHFYDGSDHYLNTGGKYNPATDTWTVTTATNAPSGRNGHTAVWTGSEMIVWGGTDGPNYFFTGGRYNPGTDSWIATSTTNAPTGRAGHTVVWSGSDMIVWGGYFYDGSSHYLNTGGRYNPGTDSWTATSTANAPTGRHSHTAVWTGSEMILWGGYFYDGNSNYLNTGGRYNPSTDSWAVTSTTNAPTGRYLHAVAWADTEMIVWGGYNGSFLNTGERYNPGTDSWTATSTANAPAGRFSHTVVWTGSEMIVWGGLNSDYSYLNTGGRYNPSMDTWVATSTPHVPTGRYLHSAVWTGSEMILWGGYNFGFLNTGERYNPGTDSWTSTSIANAPAARDSHTAVWTGSEMILWGGWNGDGVNTGGRYNPVTDSWTATNTTNAPSGRAGHTVVWTGSEMIVWGGYFFDDSYHYLNTGGRYNPGTDSWTATSTTTAPSGREAHTAVWADSEMTIWGGKDYFNLFNTGGRYNPSTASWTAISTTNAPSGRYSHTAIWASSEIIVWGGYDGSSYLNTGGRYCAQTAPMAQSAFSRKPTAALGFLMSRCHSLATLGSNAAAAEPQTITR